MRPLRVLHTDEHSCPVGAFRSGCLLVRGAGIPLTAPVLAGA